MSEIKAGVTVMQDFCRAGSIFQSYIDYLDREEAQRNEAIQTYNLYHDYMGNPEKSTGLFTSEKNSLSSLEKKELKNLFQMAQNNGSLMWQTVISFDNRWLANNNLYDKEKGLIDETQLKEVARSAINKMLEKEGMELAVWSAAIHYNTDNIHIHVATVEPYPSREIINYNGTLEYRGKFKLKNIEECKSSVVNQIMHTKEINQKINQIIRQDIVKSKEERKLAEDPEFREKFLKLYQNLPKVSKNLQHYNNNIMKPQRKLIDEISMMYLQKYHEEEYAEFNRILRSQSEKYRQAYGNYDRSYEEGKNKELFERLGNAVLREVKAFDTQMDYKTRQVESAAREYVIEVSKESEKKTEPQLVSSDKKESLKLSPKTMKLSPEIKQELEQMEEYFTYENQMQELSNAAANKAQEELSSLVDQYRAWMKESKNLKKELNPEKGEKINKEKIENMITDGIEKENPFILHMAAELHDLGRVLDLDSERTAEYYEKAYQIFSKDVEMLEMEEGEMEEERFSSFSFTAYVQYRIGKQLDRGLGVEQDYSHAAKWYEKSNLSYARYALGTLYFDGKGVDQDYEKALALYRTVENNGFASLKCGIMYEKGLGCDADQERAKQYYEIAFSQFIKAEELQADDMMEYQIGRMLYKGEGCEANLEQAIEYLELAAEKKNIHAEYLVCKIYIQHEMDEKIPESIERLTKLAEERKHINAQYALGSLYLDQEKKYFDLEKGIYYMGKAADQGNEYAQYKLGRLYTDPRSEVYDIKKGVSYLEKACEQGNEYAQYWLGKLYVNPELEIYDLEKGISYLKQACEQGNEAAQYSLGRLYIDPKLEIYDPKIGIKYLEQALEQGNEYAKFLLGCEYLKEENRETYDPERGIRYIKELAEKGVSQAQVKLGCELLKGKNIKRNVAEARTWLEKASEQGNGLAANILQDIDQYGGQRKGKGMGELDKALRILQRSMEEEHRRNQMILREYEIEKNMEYREMVEEQL